MNYFHDVYLGFLAEQIARQCEQMCVLKCSACESKIKSPLLHICHQRGLLEKLQIHFEEVRGPMLTSIDAYYDQVHDLLPHSDNIIKDRNNYINAGRLWLQLCSAEMVFYGRYVNEFNSSFIDRAFKEVKKDKGCKKVKKDKGCKNPNETLDIST